MYYGLGCIVFIIVFGVITGSMELKKLEKQKRGNKISVITVVLNDVANLRQTMESFFSQKREDTFLTREQHFHQRLKPPHTFFCSHRVLMPIRQPRFIIEEETNHKSKWVVMTKNQFYCK